MREIIGWLVLCLGVVGLALVGVQTAALARHLRRRVRAATTTPPMSILKPLCGMDDDLAANLTCFATLDYPHYELLLGVQSTRDTAYPVALAAAARWPGRVRVVVQRGMPGLNPKVNQLITLAAAAKHGVLVVSDSNVRVTPDYLQEIAAHFEDPRVGLVTHAIAGAGEERLGALLDNLHLTGAIGPGVVAAKRVGGVDIVVGKSMALRRADLRALGGFEAVKDVLAEDYVLGKMIAPVLGKEVVVAHTPVINVSRRRDVGDFFRRYVRWSVLHRQGVTFPTYVGELLMNPIVPAAAGTLLLAPRLGPLAVCAAVTAGKITLDATAGRLLGRPRMIGALAVPLKDVLIGAAWAIGLFKRTVDWRGNRLEVLPGTRIAPLASLAPLGSVDVEPEAEVSA